jgi:hypothetical protein
VAGLKVGLFLKLALGFVKLKQNGSTKCSAFMLYKVD